MRKELLLGALLTGAALCAQPPMTQPTTQNPPPTGIASPDINRPATNTPDSMVQQNNDRQFVKAAALGGMTEVELGKLATQKGSSDAVKQFGQKMIDDHSKAGDQLKQVAAEEKISIPDSLDAKHKARIDKLAKLSGTAFDRAYSKDQLKDHQQDVSDFEREAAGGTDAKVKDFAAQTLPTLKQHLSMVKDLEKDVRASK